MRPERDAAALEHLPDKGQIREGWTNGNGYAVINADATGDRLCQSTGKGRVGVHLPVADDEFPTHVRSPTGAQGEFCR